MLLKLLPWFPTEGDGEVVEVVEDEVEEEVDLNVLIAKEWATRKILVILFMDFLKNLEYFQV
jgi:hypothetical protein